MPKSVPTANYADIKSALSRGDKLKSIIFPVHSIAAREKSFSAHALLQRLPRALNFLVDYVVTAVPDSPPNSTDFHGQYEQ